MKLLEKKCSEQLTLHLSAKKQNELWLYNTTFAFFAHLSLEGKKNVHI